MSDLIAKVCIVADTMELESFVVGVEARYGVDLSPTRCPDTNHGGLV